MSNRHSYIHMQKSLKWHQAFMASPAKFPAICQRFYCLAAIHQKVIAAQEFLDDPADRHALF